MLHDYPPVTGGGLALSVRELASLVRDELDVFVLSSRLVDHFADDRGCGEASGPDSDEFRWALAVPPRAVRWFVRADVIVTHWTFSFRWLSTLALVLGPLLRKPTVCVIHTAPDHSRYNRLRHLPGPVRSSLFRLARWALRHCVAVVALSPSHSAALVGDGFPITHVLPIPVTPRTTYRRVYELHRRAHEPRPTTVGIVGELSALKGADGIPDLLQSLTPQFTFRIAGRGELAPWIAKTAASLPLEQRKRVRLSDRLDPSRITDFYDEIEYLLILSRTESQCRVAQEAMLAGVIILARPIYGLVDLITDGVTGFLLDMDDSEAIRRRLLEITNNPALAHAIRGRARAFAEQAFQESQARWRSFLLDPMEALARIGRGWGCLVVLPERYADRSV